MSATKKLNSPPTNPISLSQSTNNTTLRPLFVRSTRSPVKRKLKNKRRHTTTSRFRSPPISDQSSSIDDHLFETESPVLSSSSINTSPVLPSTSQFELSNSSISLVHLLDNLLSSEYGLSDDPDKKLVPISVTLSDKVFCIGCQSGEILIFHPVTFVLLKCMLGHVRSVLSLSIIHGDGNNDTNNNHHPKLVSTSADGTTRVWDLRTFNVESVIVAADPGSLYGSATDTRSNTMFLACQNASLQWFNKNDTNQSQAQALLKTREFSYFFQPRTLESFLTDTERKQTQSNNKLQVHLISDTQIIAHAHMGYVYTALTHPNLPKLYTGGGDGLVKIWDITKQKPRLTHVIRVQSGTVHTEQHGDDLVCVDDAAVISLAISPNGSSLYVGCQRGTIVVWDLDTMQCVRRLVEHQDHIVSLFVIAAAMPNQQHPTELDNKPQHRKDVHDLRLVSASSDGAVKVWALHDNYECLASFDSIYDCKSELNPKNNKNLPLNALVSVALHETRICVIDTIGKCLIWEANDDLLTPKSTYFVNERVASPLQVGSDLELHACSSASHSLNLPDIQLGIQLDPALHWVEAMLFALRNWIPYQTISGNPKFTYQCRAGAKYLKSVLSQLGADAVLIPGAENRNPLVVGKFNASPCSASPDKHVKHLIFYGHYDVVPVEHKQWVTDPWQLVGRNGYLYGRGVSDDKGPILAAIFAVAELASSNQLTSNVTFIIEGEEESGSVGLNAAIDNHIPLIFGTNLRADLILMSNSSWLGMHVPCLVYGQRGVVHVTVTVDGGHQHDRHAGVEGGVYHHEPLSDLVYLLAQLTDSGCSATERVYRPVQIPKFYETSSPAAGTSTSLNDQDKEEYTDLAARIIDEEDSGVLKQLQGTNSAGDTSPEHLQSALVKKWLTPTLTISRITTSMGNQESKTVIPHRASADISMRSIPGQSTAELVESLHAFLNKRYAEIQRCSSHLKNMNKIEIKVTTAADAWESDPKDLSFKACACAIQRIWKCDPLFVREGGSTIPLFWLRNRLSNRDTDGTQNALPVINLPLAQVDDRAHLSNERISIEHLIRGRLVLRECILELQKP